MTKESILQELLKIKETSDYTKTEKLIDSLKDDIRKEVEKSKGTKTSSVTIISKLMKSTDRPEFKKFHPFNYNDADFKGFLDGHRVFASENTFGYEEAEKPYKLEGFFKEENEMILVSVNINDLKAFIKTREKKSETPFVLESDNLKIGLNPKYLLDALSFCDTNTLYCSAAPFAPVQAKSANGKNIALLLPVRLNNQ